VKRCSSQYIKTVAGGGLPKRKNTCREYAHQHR